MVAMVGNAGTLWVQVWSSATSIATSSLMAVWTAKCPGTSYDCSVSILSAGSAHGPKWVVMPAQEAAAIEAVGKHAPMLPETGD
mmetsp:Transcript_63799/g.160841  ORF Transcript_63799/g.160841 Transcript_63799/m.160841 type:complete len:84 (-) Transcript_63799:420-671(-)